MNILKKLTLVISPISFLLTACQPITVNENYEVKVYLTRPGPILPIMPPYNQKNFAPMCRITCFSNDSKDAIRKLGNGISVKGYVLVPGRYDQRTICRPAGYETADISKSQDFSSVCKMFVRSCSKRGCWAGGN